LRGDADEIIILPSHMSVPRPDDARVVVGKTKLYNPILPKKLSPIFPQELGEISSLVRVPLHIKNPDALNQW
jgi:hypothetical protein